MVSDLMTMLDEVQPDMLGGDAEFEDAISRSDLEAEAQYIEDKIVQFCNQEYEDAKGSMAEYLARWDKYWAMYFNEVVSEHDNSPYRHVNIPLLSRNIKLLHAHLSKMTIPDRQKMDFFRAVPKRVGPHLEAMAELSLHARQSEYAVQQNLVDSDFASTFERGTLDLLVTGNEYALMVWEQEVKVENRLVPNPQYDHINPANNIIYGPDGIKGMVEPFIWQCEEYRSYDAPKARYIDARNVFPSEMDRNNAADCYGVSVYDTTTISDLEDNAISEGGYLYANLDKLSASDEQRGVPEIDETSGSYSARRSRASTQNTVGANVPKLKRITRFGRLDPSHVFPGQTVNPDAWAIFCEKFNIDMERARYCKTWVVEIINGKTGVRIQPLPYKRDQIPIVHHRLLWRPNQTLGEGCYKLDEYEERIYNFFNRKGLELTQKVVNPPIAINEAAFDPKWFEQHGNKFVYKENMLVKMRNTNNVRDGFNPMTFDSSPLQAIQNQMARSNSSINALSHLPPVKQGVSGDTNSATEAGLVSASADLYLDEVAEGIEEGFLKPCVLWNYWLEQQYRIEPQVVTRLDNAGRELEPQVIPPDVWLNNYAINIVGRRTVGNKAVQQMAFKEFITAWMPEGVVNKKEAYLRHAQLLDLVDAEALYEEPQPQGPPPPRVSLNARVDLNELPPHYQDAVLRENFPALDDGDGAPFGPLWPAQHQHEFPGSVTVPSASGNGLTSFNQSQDPNRSHHAPGEVERRQRGLKDAEGVTRTLAQQTRNPANGRRFQ